MDVTDHIVDLYSMVNSHEYSNINFEGFSTLTVSVSVTVSDKVYHCVNGDGLLMGKMCTEHGDEDGDRHGLGECERP